MSTWGTSKGMPHVELTIISPLKESTFSFVSSVMNHFCLHFSPFRRINRSIPTLVRIPQPRPQPSYSHYQPSHSYLASFLHQSAPLIGSAHLQVLDIPLVLPHGRVVVHDKAGKRIGHPPVSLNHTSVIDHQSYMS